MTIRVLLADDQALIRAGFAALVGSAADLEVVGQAVDGAQAVALARELRAADAQGRLLDAIERELARLRAEPAGGGLEGGLPPGRHLHQVEQGAEHTVDVGQTLGTGA